MEFLFEHYLTILSKVKKNRLELCFVLWAKIKMHNDLHF